jgi:transcriptional regulator with XRE-family HTH domain
LKLKPVDMGDESLGQQLARLRKQRGWTQKQIAQRTGIIQELVSNYETDDMILRLAEVLEVSTDELLRGKQGNGGSEETAQHQARPPYGTDRGPAAL